MAILLNLPSNPTLSYTRLSSFSSTADTLPLSLSSLSLHRSNLPQTTKPLTIRMGGGPRTYPGGVSKWQWKRMQKKKATQLLKARLMRERQIYEMRKRAELKAAVSELERPWEVVEQAAPNLFSVGADEQLKVLADRFHKPGGFDLWTEKDGPQLFEPPDCLPTSRFLPKGAVHSIRPYGRVNLDEDPGGIEDQIGLNSECDEESAYPLNSRVLSGGNRRQSGQRNNRSHRGRFRETIGSNGESSSSSNSRVFGNGDRPQTDQGNNRSHGGRFRETIGSNGESSSLSNSRVFGNGDRPQTDQRSLDKKGLDSRRHDGDHRKIGSRKSVGSRSANGAIRLPNWRQSAASSTGERRNGPGGRVDGRMEKRRSSSSSQEELYDLSLQTDGSYSLGSS